MLTARQVFQLPPNDLTQTPTPDNNSETPESAIKPSGIFGPENTGFGQHVFKAIKKRVY